MSSHQPQAEAVPSAPARVSGVPAPAGGVPPTAAALLAVQAAGGNRAAAALARQVLSRDVPPGGSGGSAATGAPPLGPDLGLITLLEDLWKDDPASMIRLGAEVLRVIPGVGLLSGLAGDLIGAGQDLLSVPTGDPVLAGIVGTTVAIRSLFNVGSGVIGGVQAVNQTVEAFLASTTIAEALTAVGVPMATISAALTGVTVVISEGLDGAGVWFSTVLFLLDGVVLLEAAAGTVLGPVADSGAWVELCGGYLANMVGDMLAILNEIVGMATGGFSQSGTVSQLIRVLRAIAQVVMRAFEIIRAWLMGVWNVLGGKAIGLLPMPGGGGNSDEGLQPLPGATLPGTLARSVNGLARAASADGGADPEWIAARVVELDAVTACQGQGAGILTDAAGQVGGLVAAATRMAEEMAAGQGGAGEIRESLQTTLTEIEMRLSLVTPVEGQAAEAAAQVAQLGAGMDGTLAFLEALEMPVIEPPPDAGVTWDIVQAGLDQIAEVLAGTKEAALTPLRQMRAQVATLEELVTTVSAAAATMVTVLTDAVGQIREAVGEADSVEALIVAIIDMATEAAAAGEGVSFSDLLASWSELASPLADLGEELHRRAAAPPAEP